MRQLNCRTSYSFGRGFGKVDEWVKRSDEIGSPIAIADYCSTWAHPFFVGKAGLGVQLPIVTKLEKNPAHALASIYPYDQDGLTRLYGLVSLAHTQTYYRPRVTWQQVREAMGEHGTLIVDAVTPEQLNGWDDTKFGFLGIGLGSASYVLRAAQEYPSVIAPGARYPSAEHRPIFEVVSAIGAHRRQGELDDEACHMLRWVDLQGILRPTLQQIENTQFIGEQIYEGPLPRAALMSVSHLPDLDEMLWEGGKLRFPSGLPSEYTERLQRELALIEEKGFGDYFRFVADVVRWAKQRFLVGPGRGSSGGSLVCYLLGITELDPLLHGTLFERFIDPTRSDLPDIDVDFPDTARDQVIEYLRDQYGKDRVAKLGTVSEWHGASAINDVSRVKGVSRDKTNALKRAFEAAQPPGQGKAIPLATALSSVVDCRSALEAAPQLGIAVDLEGVPRHTGVHAAGVLVSSNPITFYGGVDREGTVAIDGESAERLGLLKFDALGLRTLSVIQTCMELAGLEPVEYHNILREITQESDSSEAVWKLFQEDRLTGIFQFEGHAVRELTKKIKVNKFSDLCALTSLARPGPLYSGQASLWCARRMGEEEWNYIHPSLVDQTEETYGLIVYQEQAMAVVRELAGFDGGEVNKFRKTMGKKIPEMLSAMRDQFLVGTADKGLVQPQEAANIFDMLEEYSGYAFNKSHAVAYSMISWVSAYLKTHYPLEFVCAQLRGRSDEAKTKALLRELKQEGFDYVPFDIDKSEADWSIIDGKVYGGFTAVRGVGQRTAESCLALREKNPSGWKDDLTHVQRNRLLSPYNTPWHDLTRLAESYAEYYTDPRRAGIVKGGILTLEEIPEKKGSYCFIATIRKVMERVKDDGTKFINLIVEDDTGEAGITINRYKYNAWKHLLSGDHAGKDCLFRADIISDGRKWFFLSKLKELS